MKATAMPTFKCGTWYDPEIFGRLDAAIEKEEFQRASGAPECAYCERPATAQGMRGHHFSRSLRYGDPLSDGPVDRGCEIHGCNRPHCQ